MKRRLKSIQKTRFLLAASASTYFLLMIVLMTMLMMLAPLKADARGVLSFSASKNRTGTKGNIFPGHSEAVISDIVTAAPNIIALIIETDYITGSYDTAAAADFFKQKQLWTVNEIPPENVSVSARPLDELPKNASGNHDYPVSMRYTVYLHLEQPLTQNALYTIESPFGTDQLQFSDRTTRCESIKVNQAGYAPDSAVRYAVLGVYLGDGGTIRFDDPIRYHVIDQETGDSVFSGTAVYRGDGRTLQDPELSTKEHVYHLDLSRVPFGGPYRVSAEGFGVSHPFSIGYDQLERIARVYTKGLYHQRCGIALGPPYTDFVRDACHTEVVLTRTPWSANGFIDVSDGPDYGSKYAERMDISGGYHDAGDFDRRPQHIQIPIMMMSYFEAFPGHFTDGQYNLPESGNGLPDFLDEALWGMHVWEQLQILDEQDEEYGGIMGGTETDRHPEYGNVHAASDTGVYGTWEVLPETTAYGAGLFAQAARILARYPGYAERADELMQRALLAWEYLEAAEAGASGAGRETGVSREIGENRETGEKNALFFSKPRTAVMYAAEQLYLTSVQLKITGAARFAEKFEQLADVIIPEKGRGNSWPEQYIAGNIRASCQSYHFSSYLLPEYAGFTSPQLRVRLMRSLFQQADEGGYMGFDPQEALYPIGASKGFGWGAATAQGRYGDVYAFAYRLAETEQERERYYSYLSQLGDYALGLNPLGISFVTGIGAEQIRSPLHLDSYFMKQQLQDGNIPGILIYGPSEERSGADYQRVISDKLYPSWEELPIQRRWADGWSLVNCNEFSVWETMVWNVCLYGVLYDHGGRRDAPENQ